MAAEHLVGQRRRPLGLGLRPGTFRVLKSSLSLATVAALALALSGCSSSDTVDDRAVLEVSVEIDVCSGRECFAAGVPDAQVAATDGAGLHAASAKTNDRGAVTFSDLVPGLYVVTASWGDEKASPAYISVDLAANSLTIRFITAATTPR
jgi:hypothetical protein